MCTWGRQNGSKKEDNINNQWLIRNHSFSVIWVPLSKCLSPNQWSWLNWSSQREREREESGKDGVTEEKVCGKEKWWKQKSVCMRDAGGVWLTRRICTVLIYWPCDHFDLKSLYWAWFRDLIRSAEVMGSDVADQSVPLFFRFLLLLQKQPASPAMLRLI